jgi:hypothetical protein
MDAEAMRRRLEKIAVATASAKSVDALGFWVGDQAGERRVLDDFHTGRRDWLGAYRSARAGIKALDAGDLEMAEIYVWQATDFFVGALWSRMEPSDVKFLSQSAQRRGRRSETDDRNSALAAAVEEQQRNGLTGKAARHAAISQNPSLKGAFAGMSDDAIRQAANRGAKARR